MKRTIALIAAFTFSAVCPTAPDYSVADTGTWPDSWPKELEPLRKHSRSLEGPLILFRHYLIPFTKREDFEAAWPHLLKVKTKGAPIILVRAPKTDFFSVQPAGIYIHAPPAKSRNREAPTGSTKVRERWMWSHYIELAVDGDIVDLNRIPFPPDTPIVDERFGDPPRK